MRPFFLLTCCLALSLGCERAPSPESPAASEAAPADLERIRPGVWVHATYRDVEGFGRVLSQGLAVAAGEEAVLVDAGWSDDPEAATAAILAEVARLARGPVRRALFSHYHDDSMAGIDAFREQGIPTYATDVTLAHLDTEAWGRPDSVLATDTTDTWLLPVGDQQIEVFYPGPGHTVDNVVVYVPQARVLYGGCLIRPGGTQSLGNTADASIEQWAESVARVRARYGDRAEVVVPSHGPPGGTDLLDQTIALVEAQRGYPVRE